MDGPAALYAEDAVNRPVVTEPLVGRAAIRRLFEVEFGRAQMTCVVEQILQDGEWAILEWKDPKGVRGCGFFHVRARDARSPEHARFQELVPRHPGLSPHAACHVRRPCEGR